jgi:hypothetical protein
MLRRLAKQTPEPWVSLNERKTTLGKKQKLVIRVDDIRFSADSGNRLQAADQI